MLFSDMVNGLLEGQLLLRHHHFQDLNSVLKGDQGCLRSKGLFELKQEEHGEQNH